MMSPRNFTDIISYISQSESEREMSIDSVADEFLSLRPPVTIHAPSMWADTFSNFSLDDQLQKKYAEEIDELQEEARRRLIKATATPLKQMIIFIDTLERLGLAYHFQTEIEHKLQQIYNSTAGEDCDLFTTSLRFRLLRQHRYPISCNVFEKFVDEDGSFKETLSSDVEGLLSLYEAAHVRFHDENILQEAARFTRHELSCVEPLLLESPMKEKVKRAMEHPLQREVPFFHARIFISIYERDDSRDELLLKLAKINFNFLQNLYKNELSHLSRWWNKFDLKSKLPYARDRVVEAYFWGAGYHYEPQYSYARIGVAKAIILATIIDDTYDNYATLNEAQLLTQALDRWNMDAIDELPDYMKTVYHFIMSIFEDYESDAAKQEKQFAVPYLKETVQELARAYNQELKWVMGRQMPSFQDYAQNSKAPSCVYLIFACTIPDLKSVTQETINWMKTDPKFVLSTAMIGRFWNDIGSNERENKGGEMLTAVDCYMKQYGISKQETLSKFAEEIEDKWKDVNEGWAAMAAVPEESIAHLLGYARMCEATYNKYDGDGYTDPSLSQAQTASLFVDRC